MTGKQSEAPKLHTAPALRLILVTVSSAIALFCTAETVNAGEPTNSPQTKVAAASKECTNTALTKEKFLEMVKAIIQHGDLSDVPFIEKTLQMKFEWHRTWEARNQNERYEFFSLQGSKIRVRLRVNPHYRNNGSEIEPKWMAAGTLEFQDIVGGGMVSPGCSPLTKDLIEHEFVGKDFSETEMTGVGRFYGRNFGATGKNGTAIRIEYAPDFNSHKVNAFMIHQAAPAVTPPKL